MATGTVVAVDVVPQVVNFVEELRDKPVVLRYHQTLVSDPFVDNALLTYMHSTAQAPSPAALTDYVHTLRA